MASDPIGIEALIARLPKWEHACPRCGSASRLPEVCDACLDLARARREVVRQTDATVPELYRWASFAAPELSQRVRDPLAVERARGAIDIPLVVLTGPAGAGKTTLAVCIHRARAARAPGVPSVFSTRAGQAGAGYYVEALEFARARSQHGLGRGEPPSVADAMRAPFAVIDDVGSEPQSAASAVPDVVYERHQRARQTIYTTGLGREQIASVYGAGVARRLLEHAYIIDVRRGAK